ncbi:non-canonical ubiquitin conjugating enzyme 1 [Ephemerocybe angulata]|uniref:Non-canonical ubiquitin conjugating enzyme 1 n=1 Tax=Ephemerocybe angulata TaxID=980116 RepID=A0A8H6IG59_9AGAR|nr:non-canonical ubiquitin conjugating enzyme 1 [Tulosesus angulatus]
MAAKSLNKNNSAVKRIMQEARELANDPCTDYHAAPLEEWHCTLRGSPGTEFEGGLYHFRILLPAEYPFRPPSIMMLTPSGRFELNTKLHQLWVSAYRSSGYHEELWQPAWGVRTALVGLQGFFPLKGQLAAGVGSVESHPTERKRLAALSRDWTCPTCKVANKDILPDPNTSSPSSSKADSSNEAAQPRSESQSASQTPVSEPESKDSEPSGGLGRAAAPARSPAPLALRRSSHKPPLLLDAAIGFLLLIVFVIICRRMS